MPRAWTPSSAVLGAADGPGLASGPPSLPVYAPETNPVERVWWQLHEAVARNHRCRTMGSDWT